MDLRRAPKPDWSQYYSGSAEIHQYFRQVAEENDLLKYVKLNHKIVRAEWEDGRGQWKVTVSRNNDPADTFEDYGEIFLNGGGVLKYVNGLLVKLFIYLIFPQQQVALA